MSYAFLIDRTGGISLTYENLLSRLSDREYSPVFRPASTAEALVAVLTALVRGAPLRLVDSDFSNSEIHALGLQGGQLDKKAPLSGKAPASLEEAQALARVSAGFSLELYTSGSTGLPKLVRHRLDSLTRTLRIGERHAEDVWALAFNPTHIAGIQVLLQAFFNGNTLVDVFGLSRAEIQTRLQAQAVTHLSATPTFYRLLLPVDATLPSLRSLTLGGERSDAALLAQLRAAFPSARLHNLYASTEAGTLLVADGDLFGIHPAVEGKIRIQDGQLWVARELLAEFQGREVGSWYATGDRVEVISDTPLRFRIVGRENDFINVGGSKVDPAEVECALRAFPGVTEARVYGRPSSVVGTLLCAEYTSLLPLSEPDLRTHLASCLQAHKIPRIMKRVDSLAKTRTGKLSRNV